MSRECPLRARYLNYIEVFLEENDEWQFHFSKVTDIHWNSKKRLLDVTINPPCCVGIFVCFLAVLIFTSNFAVSEVPKCDVS